MRKILIVCFVVAISNPVVSQAIAAGGGFVFGYKSTMQEQGLSAYLRIKRHIDVHAGYSIMGKYNGKGFGGGLRWAILDKKFQPFIGAALSSNRGGKVYLINNGLKGIYSVSPNALFYAESGLMLKYETKEEDQRRAHFSLLMIAGLTYRWSLNSYQVNFVELNYSEEVEHNLYRRVGNGIGVNLSLIILVGKSPS